MSSIVELPSGWSNAAQVDWHVARAVSCDVTELAGIEFRLHERCSLWLDGVKRLMAYCNQMAARGTRVRLTFLGVSSRVMGYIDRMGFFDHLDPRVETVPDRPTVSGARLFKGGSNSLIEIAPIVAAHRDDELPGRLTEILRQACAARADADLLSEAAFTLFSELIGNVYDHALTSGHVALQVYRGGSQVKVVVCDDGLGLMETLRPALNRRTDEFVRLTDVELLVEMFRRGLSRHPDPKHGLGLRDCAEKAIRFQAELDVRLARQNVRLTPSRGAYAPVTAYCSDGLPLLRGTHITFTFGLAT